MSLLSKLFNNESFKKSIFERLAKQAKEAGIKKLIITINEDGNFDAESIKEDQVIIKKETHDFLLNFYNNNKNKTGKNYLDTIKP